MRFTTLFNPKGGSGKSVMTVSLATSLSVDYGLKVLVVDCDEQSTISDLRTSHELRLDVDPPYPVRTVNVDQVTEYIEHLKAKDNDYDLVFFDIPGRIDNEDIIMALTQMDYVLIPVVADQVDRLATFNFLKAMREIYRINQEQGFGMQVYAFNNKRNRTLEQRSIRQELKKAGLDFFTTSVTDYQAYSRTDSFHSLATLRDKSIPKQLNDQWKQFCDEFIEKFSILVPSLTN